MKKYLRGISLFFACLFMCCITAFAVEEISPRSSMYILSSYANITPESSGRLTIAFSISSYGKMSEIGATSIEIYESSGQSAKRVATYDCTNPDYSYIMGSNTGMHAEEVTYNGIVGYKYYAKIHLKVSGESGGDAVTETSPTVTAKR